MRDDARFEARRLRRGVALFELMLSIVLLALISAVAVPMIRAKDAPEPDSPRRRLEMARRKALERSEPQTIDWLGDSSSTRPVTVWPDGHITADSTRGIELVTGLHDTTFRAVKSWQGSAP